MSTVKEMFTAIKFHQDFTDNHTGTDWKDAVKRSDRGAFGAAVNTVISTQENVIMANVEAADYDAGHVGMVSGTSWVVQVAGLTYWQVPKGADPDSPATAATGALWLKGRIVGDDDKPVIGGKTFSVTGVSAS